MIGLITIGCRSKIIEMIGRRTSHSRISHPCRRTYIARIILSSRIIHHLIVRMVRTTRSFLYFYPINKNCTYKKIKSISPRNMSFYQYICNKNTNTKLEQMSPNKKGEFFKVIFLNVINFNALCFKKIDGRKCDQQERRIEEGYFAINIKNVNHNEKNHHRQQVTPSKISYPLKQFNHDEFRTLSPLYYNTEEVKCL